MTGARDARELFPALAALCSRTEPLDRSEQEQAEQALDRIDLLEQENAALTDVIMALRSTLTPVLGALDRWEEGRVARSSRPDPA